MNRDLMRAMWHRHREPLVIIPASCKLPSTEDSHEHFMRGASPVARRSEEAEVTERIAGLHGSEVYSSFSN